VEGVKLEAKIINTELTDSISTRVYSPEIEKGIKAYLHRNRRIRPAYLHGKWDANFKTIDEATQAILNAITQDITQDPELMEKILRDSKLENDNFENPEYIKNRITEAIAHANGTGDNIDWVAKLSEYHIPKTTIVLERKRAFESFIKKEIKEMPQSDWEVFVSNDVKRAFGLNTSDVKNVIKDVSKERRKASQKERVSALSFGDNEDMSAYSIAVLSKEFEEKYPPLFFLGGGLYVYNNGIYETSDIIKSKAKEFIYELAELHGIHISPDNNRRVLERVQDLNVVSSDELCKSPERIVVENGILDTKARTIYDINPDEKHLSRMPVRFDKNAPVSVEFIEYLRTMFKGYEWQIPIVQEMFGFCLYKKYFIEKFFFLIGNGGNGRSTLINILTKMLGEENTSALSVHDVCKPTDKHMLLDLNGKFANLCGETGTKEIENLGKLKAATGGDLIVARDLYKSWVKFENYSKFIFSMNEAPAIYDGTRGRKRRMVIIKFPVDFEAGRSAEDKEELITRLCSPESLSGILNWSLEGLSRLLINKVMSDDRTENEMAVEYDKLAHPIRHFISAHIDTVQTYDDDDENLKAWNVSRVTEHELSEAYDMYAKKHGLPSQNKGKLIGVIKAECTKLGIDTMQCRDRYHVDARTREPLHRDTFLKGIVIKGRDYLSMEKAPEYTW
jgi:P4 family phage/plasmid primase-like protien